MDLLIKNYAIKKNQGYPLTQNTMEENQTLTNIATHMGITVEPDTKNFGSQRTKKDRTAKSMGDENQSRLEQWK